MSTYLTPEQERLLKEFAEANQSHITRFQRSQDIAENEAQPEPKRPKIVRAWEYRGRVMP